MIQGAPKYVMLVFFGIGFLFVGFSTWALFATDIPQEQFSQDPRFEKDYRSYYQWLAIFGIIMIVVGGIFAKIGQKMSRNQGSRLT